MDQGQGGRQARVAPVRVVGAEVGGPHHALVEQGAGGQGGDVELVAGGQVGAVPDDGVDRLAEDEEPALEGIAGGAVRAPGQKQLADDRLTGLDALAEVCYQGSPQNSENKVRQIP